MSVQPSGFKASQTSKTSKKAHGVANTFAVSRLKSAGQRHEFVDNSGRAASGVSAPTRWADDLETALNLRSNENAKNVALDPNIYTHYFGAPNSGRVNTMAGLRIMAKPAEFIAFFHSIYVPYADWINESIQQSGSDLAALPTALHNNLSALKYPLPAPPTPGTPEYNEYVALMWMLYTSFNPFNVDTSKDTRVAFEAGREAGSADFSNAFEQFAQYESRERSSLSKKREANRTGKSGIPMSPERALSLIEGYANLSKNKRNIQTRPSTGQDKVVTGKHRGGRNVDSFIAEYEKLIGDKYMLVATTNKGEPVTFSSTGSTGGKSTYSGRSTVSLPTGRTVVNQYSFLDLPGLDRLLVRTTNPNWLAGLTLAAQLIRKDPSLTREEVSAHTKPITILDANRDAALFNPNAAQ